MSTDIPVGGVLYGYNQGVFSSVQVMQRFLYRFPQIVSPFAAAASVNWANAAGRRRNH
jgi:hypothetical protein